MKLWVKTLTGLGAIGTIAGATVGGMYAYSKLSPSVQGHAHAASLPLENDLNPMSSSKDERDAFAKLDLHFINQGDNPTTSIAKYIPNFDDSSKDVVEYNGKTMEYQEFLESYILETGNQPTLVTYAGTALFQNQYLTAVTANDFARYVAWFMINVSWGPDMSSLDSFTIVRGIEKVGSAIMLGGHASIKKEATNIKFYPDAFFGSLPMYSNEAGSGNAPDSLLFKANIAPLTWSGVQRLIKANKESNATFQGKSKLRYIEDIGTLPGSTEHGYIVYCDAYTGLIDELLDDKVIGKITTKHNLTGPYIDENGDAKIGVHDGVDLNTRVSYLDVLNVSKSGFHGIGYNFLKYVGAHEYGHHQTLQTASDISESGVLSGAYSTRTGISASSMYDKNIMNLYFSARAPQLRVTGESATSEATDSPRDQIPKFWERHKEEQGNPFGADASKGDGRAAMTWDEIVAEAKRRKISLWAMFLENSFDTKSGSLNPATNQEQTYFYDKDAKKFVISVDGIKTKGLMKTYSALKADGTVDEVPVEFTLVNIGGNPALWPKVVDDSGEWIIHNKDGSNIYPGSPSEIPTGNKYTYEQLAQINISTFVMELPYFYSINGWNVSKDGTNADDVATKKSLMSSQIYEDFASIFSDYTNNFPEVLTRDNLQTVYMPSAEELDYTPDYLTGISEASTGLEYYIDSSLSSKWLEDARSARAQYPLTAVKLFDDYRTDFEELFKDVPDMPAGDQTSDEYQAYLSAAMTALNSSKGSSLLASFSAMIDNFAGTIQTALSDYILQQIESDPRGNTVMGFVFASMLSSKYKYPTEADPNAGMDQIDAMLELLRKNSAGTAYNWVDGVERTDSTGTSAIGGFRNQLLQDVSTTSFAATTNFFLAPNYIGQTQKSQNGWLKDRTMKLTLGSNLYMEDGTERQINVDNDGNAISSSDPNYWNPNDIIKELDGKTPAKTYAEAQWLYALRTKGIGARTVTGLWRSKERDAVYMWGYIPTVKDGKTVTMPKFIQFTDKTTGEKIYLPVTTDVDNLHYYKTQKEGAQTVSLDHEHTGGDANHVPYTSWMSDFASMGAYRNALLKGGHEFNVEFTDEDKKVITGLFTMGPTGETGSRTVIAENGKTPSQAPTVLTTDAGGAVTITVKKQFNI